MEKETIYINHDERLGDKFEFTIPEMVKQYRELGWDQYENEDEMGYFMQTMTDEEIVEDLLSMDIIETKMPITNYSRP